MKEAERTARQFVSWLEEKYHMEYTPLLDYELEEQLEKFLVINFVPRVDGILEETEKILLEKYEDIWKKL